MKRYSPKGRKVHRKQSAKAKYWDLPKDKIPPMKRVPVKPEHGKISEDNKVMLSYCGPQCFADKELKFPICPKCDEKWCYCKPECGALREAFIKGYDKDTMMTYARILDCGWPVLTSENDDKAKTSFSDGQFVVGYRSIDKLKYPFFGRVSQVLSDGLKIEQFRHEDIGLIEVYESFLSDGVYPSPEDILETDSTFEVMPDFNDVRGTIKTNLEGYWREHNMHFHPFDFDRTYTRYYDLDEIKKVFKKYDLREDVDVSSSTFESYPHGRRGSPRRNRESPKGASIKFEDFLAAIKREDRKTMQKYIAQGHNLDRRAPEGSPFPRMNALAVAIFYDKNRLVSELIQDKNDLRLDLKDAQDRTPLLLAIEKGNNAVIKLLLEKHPKRNIGLNKLTKDGKTALDLAIETDQVGLMKMLLEAGAQFKYAQEENKTSKMCISSECRELLDEFEKRVRADRKRLRTLFPETHDA